MVNPANLEGATGQPHQMIASWDELNAHLGPRRWINIVGPRGGIKAGRRLMDDNNHPLDDYWQTLEAPAWENDATPMLAWQTTNHYTSSLDAARQGRGSWLRAEIKRLYALESPSGSPDKNAMGGKPDGDDSADGPADWHTLPSWRHHDLHEAIKWQGRKHNRARPAVVQKVQKQGIIGVWLPSRVAVWGKNGG